MFWILGQENSATSKPSASLLQSRMGFQARSGISAVFGGRDPNLLQPEIVPPCARAPAASGFLEKRREHRHRVLKGATIICGLRNSETGCILRNQNSGGAELALAADAMIPSEFVLFVPVDGVGYRTVLRWRSRNSAGVQFLGIQPKPRHHYG